MPKRRTTRGKNNIITQWLADPKKLEEWAIRKLYFTALTLEDVINDPGQGQGSQQAQLSAVTKLYDLICVMLEDILPHAEEFSFGGQGKKVPKHEAGQPEDAGATTRGRSRGFRSKKVGGFDHLGDSSVGVHDGSGSGDGQTDLLDPGREG